MFVVFVGMTVYLVAMRLKREKTDPERGFVEAWGHFIRGPVGHVELAFVTAGRPTYGFSVTVPSVTARFGVRSYNETEQKATMLWFELPGVDEAACEKYCRSRVGKDTISLARMVASGMPFEAPRLVNLIAALVMEPETVDWWALVKSAAFDAADAAPAQPDTAAFCSTTTIKALQACTGDKLKGVDPYTCTANDAVVLAIAKLGAIQRPRPDSPRTTSLVDDEIIRSERWF